MSVCLKTLKGGSDSYDVEVMAPDYDCTSIWLWPSAVDDNDRIDLSRDQLRELRTIIDEVLAK